jgi:hypothetical protein
VVVRSSHLEKRSGAALDRELTRQLDDLERSAKSLERE